MSSICGFFYTDGKPASSDTIHGMVNALNHWRADDTGVWHKGPVALGHLMLHTTPESLNEKLPFNDHESRMTITADARIDNRDELFGKLNIPESEREKIPDSILILRAYQKWGIDTPQNLFGDFAFAIRDEKNNLIFCARDHIGIKPFYYYCKDNLFAFATEMKGILSIKGVDKSVSEQWIVDFLCSIYPDKTDTLYNQIIRLEGAHRLIVRTDGIKKIKYWQLDPTQRLSLRTDEDYISGFREKLFGAVKSRLRSCYPIGSELSGGLDSSAISAIAQGFLKERGSELTTISDVFPDQVLSPIPILKDEKPDILQMIKHAGIKNCFFVTGQEKSTLESLDEALKLHDEPTKELMNIYYGLIYEEAENKGLRVLLSGLGGDIMVSTSAPGFYEELLNQGNLNDLWHELRCLYRLGGRNPFSALIRLIIKSFLGSLGVNQENGYQFFSIFKKNFYQEKLLKSLAINQELIERLEIRKRWFKYNTKSLKGNINQRLIQMMFHPEAFILRIEYCTIATTARRMEYRYPLLDVPLVEYYLSLPSHLKRHDGYGRYIFRRAIEGIVPKNIQWKMNKIGTAGPSALFRIYRDLDRMIRFLENVPKESKIHTYVDLQQHIKYMRAIKNKKMFRNYRGAKIYLLEKTLKTLSESS